MKKEEWSDLPDLRTIIGEYLTIYSESPEEISHPCDITAVLWYHRYFYLTAHTTLSYAYKNAPDKYIALLVGDNIAYQGSSRIYITKFKKSDIRDSDKKLFKGDKDAKSWCNTYIKPGKPE